MAQGISLVAPLGNKINVRGRSPARERGNQRIKCHRAAGLLRPEASEPR